MIKNTLRKAFVYKAMLVVFVLAISGCAFFISNYDVLSYEHLTSLKAYHLKFIDDFTAAEDKQWDSNEFVEKRDQGDLKFRETLEYEKGKSKKDINREKAMKNLYDEFKSDCAFLEKRAREGRFFFSVVIAAELKEQVERNYGYAVSGEMSRVEATK